MDLTTIHFSRYDNLGDLMDYTTLFILSAVGFAAAFLSGTSAIGGAAIMTIALTFFLGGEFAVPALTIVMLIANLTRAISGYKEIDWKNVGYFLITSLPLSLLGALGFTLLPKNIVNKLLGIATITFVIIKHFKFKEDIVGKKTILSAGFISGFLSGFVGSSGPISAALFFSLGLSPAGYVASEAAAVSVLHIGKIIVYGSILNISPDIWIVAAIIGLVMIGGTMLARKYIKKIKPESFEKYVSIIMIFMGVYMILF